MKQKNILFIGIGCIALSILLEFLLFSEEEMKMSLYTEEHLQKIPLFVLVASVVLLMPIVEELIFRSWIFISPKLFFLPGLTLVIFTYYVSNIYIALLILTLYFAQLILYIKWRSSESHKTKLNFTFALISSIIFSILHLLAYDNPLAITTKSFYYFGGGLILTFVGLNFHYIFMFLSHIVFNFIVLNFLLFSGNFQNQQQTNESFSIEIKSVPFYTPENHFFSADSIHIVGRKAQIANSIHPHLRIKSIDFEFKLYEVIIRKIDSNVAKNEIFYSYIDLMDLTLDSLETDCFEMNIDSFIECANSNCYLSTPEILSNLLFNRFNVCVNTNAKRKLVLDRKLLEIKDFDEARRFLLENHGIKIQASQQKGFVYTVY